MGGGQGGAAAGAMAGAGGGGAARVVVDQLVTFKCLTCTLKEGQYWESWAEDHKLKCRKFQKGRQEDRENKNAKKKPAPAPEPKPKKWW